MNKNASKTAEDCAVSETGLTKSFSPRSGYSALVGFVRERIFSKVYLTLPNHSYGDLLFASFNGGAFDSYHEQPSCIYLCCNLSPSFGSASWYLHGGLPTRPYFFRSLDKLLPTYSGNSLDSLSDVMVWTGIQRCSLHNILVSLLSYDSRYTRGCEKREKTTT